MSKSKFGGAVLIARFNQGHVFEGELYRWSQDPNPLVLNDMKFFASDVQTVCKQTNCERVELIKKTLVIVTDPAGPKQTMRYQETYFMYGVDTNNVLMDQPQHYIAAPCPPYCSGGHP